MKNYKPGETCITGLGVTSAVGQGKTAFISALLDGRHAFGVMKRAGRQSPAPSGEAGEGVAFVGAEIPSLTIPESIDQKVLRTASFSGQVALVTLNEAWSDARLDDVDPDRVGLVIGGSNVQQRELIRTQDAYRGRLDFLRPTYGMSFMDTDLCGLCTASFGIQGFAYTLGAASASGQVAILQAAQAVQSRQVDICIAMGALMDLSYWECQGLRSLGAMGSGRYAREPALACRPFDRGRDGFIYGESCGVIVVERSDSLKRKHVKPYARISAGAMGMDRNRNPNPSLQGEVRIIETTLERAGLSAKEIDYVNPHGTGSPIGDETEIQALRHCDFSHAYINATKSITGHGLSSAGAVEAIAILLQMQEGRLHPTRNLEDPIEPSYNWVQYESIPHAIRRAINLSMGFGGVNSAMCLERY
jgi:malonyl-ACP decarboxylase